MLLLILCLLWTDQEQEIFSNRFYKCSFLVIVIIIMQALASTLNTDEIADLRDQFNAIDIDKNGTITLEEMRQV